MRDALGLDQREEAPEVGRAHDDDAPAEREHGEAQHPGRVGQRRQREVRGPAAERVAHQRQRGHRLEVAGGQHHALGQPGRPAGADEHRQVVGRFGLVDLDALGEPVREVLLIQAHRGAQPGQLLGDLGHHVRVAGVKQQALAVEELEQHAVLVGLVARVDRAPDRAAPRDPEDGRERGGVVGREDPDLAAGADPGRGQRARHAPAEVDDVAVGQRALPLDEARRLATQRGALVEVVDERGHLSRGRSVSA